VKHELDLNTLNPVIMDEDLINYKNIRKLNIAKKTQKLPIGAFSSNTELKKVYFEPQTKLSVIPEYTFANCINLKSMNKLPNELVSIEDYAFKGCKSLKEIYIPDGVLYVGEHAFDGWREDQKIYMNKSFIFSQKCKAEIIDCSMDRENAEDDENLSGDEDLGYYIVRAKCGHVGKKHYVPINFPIRAHDAKEAASITRAIGRVKHHHRDAILEVRCVKKSEYLEQVEKNTNDPYLSVQSKHAQDDIFDQIKNRLVIDPHYIPVRDKRRITNKKSDASSEYKVAKLEFIED